MYNPDEECRAMISALQKACKDKGISPNALAKKAGISTSTISYLISGKTQPQLHTILTLCNVLDLRISELIDRDKLELGMSAEERDFLESYRRLPEIKKKMVKTCIDMVRDYKEIGEN